jgi:GT2 family glycosyltransferase
VVLRNAANEGVAEGNNIGIRAALRDGCSSVLLINNDTAFEPDLLSELIRGMRRHECDMVVPKILFFDEPQKIWSAGGYFSAWRGSARHFGFGKKDDGHYDQPRAVRYSPTCCMLITREAFTRVGLMDANYFVYFDDTDFSLRAYRMGIKLFYIPTARLLHKVSSLTGGESAFTYRYTARNHVYYLLKNFPRWYGIYYFPAFQFHIFTKHLLLRRSPKSFWVAQKAFWEGVSLFFSTMERAAQALESTETQ